MDNIAPILALIGVLGIGAQWLAWRLNVPAIVVLTVFGVLAGPVFGWLHPSADLGALAAAAVKLGVAIILLEGGLSLRFGEIKEDVWPVVRLVVLGAPLGFLLGTAAAHYVGGLPWSVAFMFGAITIVTGPTVIIPLLRHARLHRRPASFLKWEGILNDPVGALLAVVVFEYLFFRGQAGALQVLPHLGAGLLVAAVLGVGGGYLLGWLYRRDIVPEYLKGPVLLAVALAVYVLANHVLEEAGLLATTALGVTLANVGIASYSEMRRFKEYIALLLVSAIFIILTADLDPAILLQLDWHSLALLGAMLFVVRPLTVLLSTAGSGMTREERLLLAWIAPRGIVAAAVAGVFGPRLAALGFEGGAVLLPLVFALVLSTVVLHGFTISRLAKKLGLAAAGENGVLIVGASSWSIGFARALQEANVPVMIADASWHRLRQARLAGVPVYYGQVLSETSEHRLEFTEAKHLLAATDNDAYNALVCNHFAAELGRGHIFQLPALSPDASEEKRVARTLRGLIAPSENARFDELLVLWYRGWTFQRTRLSENYAHDELQRQWPSGSIAVALIKENGVVQINSPERPIKPVPGDMVVWFGPKAGKAGPSEVAPEEAGPAGDIDAAEPRR